jgi:hypothetical protein
MEQISKTQLQKGDVFRREIENDTYDKAVKKYTTEVVETITKDLISRLNSKAMPKYVYRFGKPYLPGHPQVPPCQNQSHKNAYQNEVEKIYPVNQIFDALKAKYPDCKVTMDSDSYNITIDWQ